MPGMDGECNCGAIKVHVEDPDLFTQRRGHICHCINCRKTAGSAFATNLIIPLSQVTLTGDSNLSLYEDPKSRSGNTVRRFFCKTCGNPIKSETDAATKAGKVILKLGIFEKIPEPEHETFNCTRVGWVGHAEGTKRWEVGVGGEEAKS